jgi:pyruvate/2-oxoglutarate dehydrogenase complex dihydrolipoamide dehydrogenase (E3) component
MPKADGAPRKVVVVGGGPAGLEASRVCAERGHRVVLFEAASQLGGQLLIAARAGWRRDMRGIVDWLVYEAEELGADLRTNCLAGQDDVLAQEPDVVIVATGGLPDLDWLEGAEHCTTTWDVLGGAIAPGENVLVFDGLGQSQAPSCADYLAAQGARVDLVSPEQMFAIDVNYNERVIQRKRLYERGVKITLDTRIVRVERVDNGLRAILANTLTGAPEERLVDQVVIERGTIPVDELYTELTPMSRNLGVLDIEAMLERRSQQMRKNPDGAFELYRVGDAVACRDVHAAMLDSRRLCVTL